MGIKQCGDVPREELFIGICRGDLIRIDEAIASGAELNRPIFPVHTLGAVFPLQLAIGMDQQDLAGALIDRGASIREPAKDLLYVLQQLWVVNC
jgi:hypothetical protein